MLSRRHCLAAPWLLAPALGAVLQAKAQPAAARRVVAVGGALTETVYALGAQAELVGVDTTSLYPAEATRLPSVGYARALSAEGLLSLKPTLVLASGEAGPPVVLQQLQAAGVPLVTLDAGHRAEQVLARTRRVAELLGREAAGQALVAQLQQAWQAAQARVATLAGPPGAGAAPRVLFVLSHAMNQVRIGGRDTAADAMIRYAGARNALAEVQGFKPLTPEAAIAAAPDVILATEQGLTAAGGVDGLLAAPGLAATPAGRARRVVALEALFMLGFGPRLPQAVVQLAEQLHRPAKA
jgi:iron complex transport system substrate-binding protein